MIEADVKVHDALISGRIVGTLEATEKVHLQSNAAFVGKIKTRILIVEEGAIFKAECDAGGELQLKEPDGSDESAPELADRKSG